MREILPLLNDLDIRKKLILRKNQFAVLKPGLRKVKDILDLTTIAAAGFTGIYPIGNAVGFRLSRETVRYRINGVCLECLFLEFKFHDCPQALDRFDFRCG